MAPIQFFPKSHTLLRFTFTNIPLTDYKNESAKRLNRISAKDSGTLCNNCNRNTWNRSLDANAGQVQFGDELIKQNSLVLAGKEGRKEVLTKTRKKHQTQLFDQTQTAMCNHITVGNTKL